MEFLEFLIQCMVYVDLNMVRGGEVRQAHSSRYTSKRLFLKNIIFLKKLIKFDKNLLTKITASCNLPKAQR